MPLIQTISPANATGDLAALYGMIKKMGRDIDKNALVLSSSPELLRQQLSFVGYYMNHPSLSMPLLASIRILVSNGEDCEFCVEYNTAMLINLAGWSMEQISAMKKNPDAANLNQRELAMLKFVLKGIRNSHGITADDLDVLREMKWNDVDILDALNHGARILATDILFNAFNVGGYQS